MHNEIITLVPIMYVFVSLGLSITTCLLLIFAYIRGEVQGRLSGVSGALFGGLAAVITGVIGILATFNLSQEIVIIMLLSAFWVIAGTYFTLNCLVAGIRVIKNAQDTPAKVLGGLVYFTLGSLAVMCTGAGSLAIINHILSL